MKLYYQIIIYTIIATLAVVLFFQIRNHSNDKYSEENKELTLKNVLLERQNDSLKKQIDTINIQLKIHQDNIDILAKHDSAMSDKYEQTKSEIKKLRDKYAKVSRIDSFKSVDIIRYFADSLGLNKSKR
jgi:predicted nuclease with TOPRIM domain